MSYKAFECSVTLQAVLIICVSSQSDTLSWIACTAGRPKPEHGLQWLQELQAVKGKVEELTAERDKAMSKHVIVQQQRDCHADHAQLLVKECKRLRSQLQALQLQSSQAGAALQSSMEKQDGRKPADSTVKMKTSERMVPREDDSNSQTPVKGFDGHDVKNALHKKPFDLSNGSRHKPDVSSTAILKQAQQMRAASRT